MAFQHQKWVIDWEFHVLQPRGAHHFLNDREVGRHPGSVHPHVSTRRDDKALQRVCSDDPFDSASQLKAVSAFLGCS